MKPKREFHPYGDFIPRTPRLMIIGTFPIAKFTDPTRRGEIKEHEFDFFFGGEKNLLWKLLGKVFNRSLTCKEEIISLLEREGIAIGDLVKSCRRKNGRSSDSDLYDIEWNKELIKLIRDHHIKKLFFTSKKVEQLFNKLFPESTDLVKVRLISPSAQAARSLYCEPGFNDWRKRHPTEKSFKFILTIYRHKFVTGS